jgi:hybrid cluster-associated redox disulfide protein
MASTELGDMIVAEIMARWPGTISVFVRRRMSCPGCPMAPFMTAADAAREYRIPPHELVCELRRAIDASPNPRAGGAA